MSTTEKKTGVCKWFNAKKGFGFITRNDGEEDVFVHQSGIHAEGFRSLAEAEPVEFTLTQDDQGRLKAIEVTGPDGAFVKGAPKPNRKFRRRRRKHQNDGEGEEQRQQNVVEANDENNAISNNDNNAENAEIQN